MIMKCQIMNMQGVLKMNIPLTIRTKQHLMTIDFNLVLRSESKNLIQMKMVLTTIKSLSRQGRILDLVEFVYMKRTQKTTC